MAPERFCVKCGNPVEQGNAFCGNCGTPTGASTSAPPIIPPFASSVPAPEPKKRRTIAKVALGVIAISVIVIVFVAIISGGSNSSNSSSPSANVASALVLPAAESQFISIVSAAQSASRQVENDMQRGGVKAKRDNALCQQMPSSSVSNWVGTVAKVDSNSDGKGVFYVNIAPDINLETWNNALSDIEDNTLMEPGSRAFNAASMMKPGESVIFSGTFIPFVGDCIRESSLSLKGKVESPEFIFRFSQVAPYSSSAATHLTEEQTSPAQSSPVDTPTAPTAAGQGAASSPNQAPDTGNYPQDNNPAPNQAVDATAPVATSEDSNSVANYAALKQADRIVNIPATLAADRLVAQVDPHYPLIAKAAHVSGTVVLHAIITKDGTVGSLSVVSGPAMLQQSALEAVKLWRYRPYMVNNEPTEFETSINVIFTLGG